MSADTLQSALASIGISATVEERGRVAVVIPDGELGLAAPARRQVVGLAREHGFSNVCVELAPRDANLSGD